MVFRQLPREAAEVIVSDIHCHLTQLQQREIVVQYRDGYIPGLSQSLTGLGGGLPGVEGGGELSC